MTTLRISYIFVLGTLALGGIAHAGMKTKCDVVRSLKAANVGDSEIRDWLCLVKHESNFRYDAVNRNSDGSKDYGIYQLNNRYWCDRGNSKYSRCWQINSFGCGYRCRDFINSGITWDTDCAVKIKRCNSFNKWYGWIKHCKGRNLNAYSEYNFRHCLIPGN